MKNIDRINEDYEKMKVVEREVLTSIEEGYVGKRTYKVTLADGSTITVDQIRKNKRDGDAVVIVPITEENKFLMVVESRPNTRKTVAVEFPAGMVDENEDPMVAAKRELVEETGYDCQSMYLLEEHYQDQGCSAAIIRTYVALGCKKVREQSLDKDERVDFIEMSYDEILDMVMNNNVNEIGINDANSKIAFMTYTMKKGE